MKGCLMANTTDNGDNKKALEALVVDNPDLERLEALLDHFNIFEAIGAVQQELRHSDVLAFLLNPSQNHGLGDIFVKRLLQKSFIDNPDLQVTPIDLDLWELSELEVRREWQNVDILLIDSEHRMVVIIENKIRSGEHSNQLERYRREVSRHYPGWHLLSLFLTPEGDPPSNEEYITISYNLICELVETLVESRKSTLGPDVLTLLTHYTQMLRRHIVSESEIAILCRRIYRKHQRAIDLIYEYRPDLQEEIKELLEDVISNESRVILDHGSKTYIRFSPVEWETPVLLAGKGWTASGRMLLFQFANRPNHLNLHLVLGPGPLETRQKIFEIAQTHKPPFKPAFKALGKNHNTIFQRSILTANTLEGTSLEDLEDEIRNKWQQFLDKDLPSIHKILKEHDWIWN
jgi:hypothetical protein